MPYSLGLSRHPGREPALTGLRFAWPGCFLHLMESKKTVGFCCAHEVSSGQPSRIPTEPAAAAAISCASDDPGLEWIPAVPRLR